MGKTTVVQNLVLPNGLTYSGQMKGKKREGKGQLIWPDGTSYEGDFKKNQLEGIGKMKFPNGNVYEGSFVKNNIHGKGKLTTLNNETVDGFFQFRRRFITTDGYNKPVGEYMLNVAVTTSSGQTKGYHGPATLHIESGLIVLPGMSDSTAPVYDAVVVAIQSSTDEKDLKTVQATVASTPAGKSDQGGLAMGVNDSAYQNEVKFKSKAVNWFNPKNFL